MARPTAVSCGPIPVKTWAGPTETAHSREKKFTSLGMGIPIRCFDDCNQHPTTNNKSSVKIQNLLLDELLPEDHDRVRAQQGWAFPTATLWQIRARVRISVQIPIFLKNSYLYNLQILGGGGEIFFPLPPTFCSRRPDVLFILNLRTDPNSAWEQDLPQNWRDIQLKICCSQDFHDEFLDSARC